MVIALAVVAYGDPVTVRAVAGYTAATYGFVMYQEARAKAAAAAAAAAGVTAAAESSAAAEAE